MLDLIVSISFIVFTVVMYMTTYSLPGAGKWDILGSRAFPRLLLVFMGIVGSVILIFSIIRFVRSRRSDSGPKTSLWAEYREIIVIYISMFLLLLGFDYLGFFLGAILFLYFLQWYLNKGGLTLAHVLVPVISVALIYVIFSRFLNVLFPLGVFDSIL